MTKYLDRKAILGTSLRTKELEIEEWGGTVLIQEPSAATARFLANLPENHHRHTYWAVRCMVDENGERLFQDSDVTLLMEKASTIVTFVVDEIIDSFGLLEKKARYEEKRKANSD